MKMDKNMPAKKNSEKAVIKNRLKSRKDKPLATRKLFLDLIDISRKIKEHVGFRK